MAESSTFSRMTSRVGDAFLAPLVAVPNIGLAAINATIGGTARIAESAAKAATGSWAEAAEEFSRRVGDRALDAAKESTELMTDALGKLVGDSGDTSANTLLTRTLMERTTATAALPLLAAVDAVRAAREVDTLSDAGEESWLLFSKLLDLVSKKGVLPGEIGAKTAAKARLGFFYMTTQGPLEAVADDVRGIAGGSLALAMGDFDWLAEALPKYHRSMEYVYDKAKHDEVQPESDFPIGESLADSATATIDDFPHELTEALETDDAVEVLEALFKQPGEIATLLFNYPNVEFRVVWDVLKFTTEAYFEAADAERYSLCELAIMESSLADEEKDECLAELRDTAPNTTIEFEYYVPLLVPKDGKPEDRAFRHTAGGKRIDHGAVAESVFEPRAIDRAQAICSELLSYRPMLWLYRDEKIARQKNHAETVRKFGKAAAERIERDPLYPLTDDEVAELTEGGGRPMREVNELLVEQLRERGLDSVANRVEKALSETPRRRTPDKRDRYRTAIETGDFELLAKSLTPKVKLYTPVRPEPIVGRDGLLAFMGNLVQIIQDFRFTHELDSADGSAKSLTFKATVPAMGDGEAVELQATDLLEFTPSGQIRSITAMARPIQALMALSAHGVSIPE